MKMNNRKQRTLLEQFKEEDQKNRSNQEDEEKAASYVKICISYVFQENGNNHIAYCFLKIKNADPQNNQIFILGTQYLQSNLVLEKLR